MAYFATIFKKIIRLFDRLPETSSLTSASPYFFTPVVGIVSGVAGAACGWPMTGPVVLVLWIAALSFRVTDLSRRFGFATLVALIGTAMESALIAGGVYLPQDALQGSLLCPLWIIAGWFSLGLAIPNFAPQGRMGYLRIAVCGALLAPLVYLSADKVLSGALHLRRPLWPTLILIALLWQGMLPGLCWLSQTRWYRTKEES